MDINMTTKEIADTIAEAVTETTSLRCETFTDECGNAVIIADYTHIVARVILDFTSIKVVAAPFDLDAVVTDIPSKATSLNGVRELATHLDDAIAHVIAAAVVTARQ